jgi:hypothetical protein
MMIEISLLFHSETIHVPKWDMLKEYKPIANLKGLMASPGKCSSSWFWRRRRRRCYFLVLPPFLAHALMDSGFRYPCELIIEAMNAISTFDTSRHEEDEDTPDDKEALAHIFQFLWELCYIDWSSSLHKECLATPPAL